MKALYTAFTAAVVLLLVAGASCASQQQSEERETEGAASPPTTSEPQSTSVTRADLSALAEEQIAAYEKAKERGDQAASDRAQATVVLLVLDCQLEQATGSTNQAEKEAYALEALQQAEEADTNVQTILAERGYGDCGYSRAVEAGVLEGPQTNVTDSPQGPSSAEVVQAFRDAGLEVGGSFPVEQDPGWSTTPVPKTYKEATRFEIPSMGEDAGGRVFVFESRADLTSVHDYYENLSEGLRPHLYVEDGVLLQLNNQLPVSEARKYRDVLRDTV